MYWGPSARARREHVFKHDDVAAPPKTKSRGPLIPQGMGPWQASTPAFRGSRASPRQARVLQSADNVHALAPPPSGGSWQGRLGIGRRLLQSGARGPRRPRSPIRGAVASQPPQQGLLCRAATGPSPTSHPSLPHSSTSPRLPPPAAEAPEVAVEEVAELPSAQQAARLPSTQCGGRGGGGAARRGGRA